MLWALFCISNVINELFDKLGWGKCLYIYMYTDTHIYNTYIYIIYNVHILGKKILPERLKVNLKGRVQNY